MYTYLEKGQNNNILYATLIKSGEQTQMNNLK